MMKNFKQFAIIIFLAFTQISCEDDVVNCEQTVACTEIFVSISVEITDTAGQPVALDHAYTFIDSRNKIEFQISDNNRTIGVYRVADDSHMDDFDFEGTTVIFVGEKNGKNIVEHQMVIGKDCCHILLIAGDDEIVIEA